MDKLPRWVEVWGPVVLVLSAMWLMVGRSEDRLAAQIAANRQAIESNREAIGEVERRLGEAIGEVERRLGEVIGENGKAIARLEVRVQRVEDDVTWLRNNH
ncbi:MAG: hypothetical protein F4X47_00720 [Gammaproteobacteria bacterium]|nr:hypothetical protein [Gammaproteobacteria bacterium]